MTQTNPESAHYSRLHAILSAAREKDGVQRAELLAQLCGENEALRSEVEELLSALERENDAGVFSDSQIAESRAALEALLDRNQGQSEWLPDKIGGYTIQKRLGEGGMGIVYQALQESPRRKVAIKLLHPLHATPERMRRFRHEAEVLGRLRHPGIAQIFEAGVYDLGRGTQPFFAMEHVVGTDLRTFAKEQHLDVRARLELVAKVCDAVQYAHEKGIIHRDIKPENVLVDEDGQPKVLDFGIARANKSSTVLSTIITDEGQLVGTLSYMAPEQLQRSEGAITPKVDVYALGVLAFELLTGRLPHEIAELPISVAVSLIANTDAPPAGKFDRILKGDVEIMLGRALETEPARRYPTAAAFASDIRRFLADLPIVARRPSRIYLARKFTRRHRGLTIGAVATTMTLVVGVIVALVLANQEREQRQRADENAYESRRNEVQAVSGLMRAAEDALDRSQWFDGLERFESVPELQRDWSWQLEHLRSPNLLPLDENLGWSFVDDDHLLYFDRRAGDLSLHSISSGETRVAYSGITDPDRSAPTRKGLILAGDASAVHLIDLFSGTARMSWPHAPAESENAPTDLIGRANSVSHDGRVVVLHTRALDRAEVWIEGKLAWSIALVDPPEDKQGSCSLSPDGEHLIVNRSTSIGWFDLHSGEERRFPPSEGFESIGGAALADGWVCLQVVDGRVARTRHDYETMSAPYSAPEAKFSRDQVGRTKWSEDGKLSTVATWGSFRLLDSSVEEPRFLSAFEDKDGRMLDPTGYVMIADFSPNSRRILAQVPERQPWLIELADQEVSDQLDPRCTVLRGHTEWIYHLAVSPDGSLIASAAPTDPFIRVWDAYSLEEIAALERHASYGSSDALLAFSTDGDRLVATTTMPGQSGLGVVEWNLLTGASKFVAPDVPAASVIHAPMLDTFLDVLEPGPLARLSQKAQMVGDKAMSVWRHSVDNPMNSLNSQPDTGGRRWIPAPDPEFAYKWDTVALSAHPDGKRVAIISADVPSGVVRADSGRIAIRDLATGELERVVAIPHRPWCGAFSPDGKLFAVGTNDRRLLVLETEFWTTRLDVLAHTSYLYSLAWMPEGVRLVTASGDKTLKVWDPRPLAVHAAESASWNELRESMRARGDLAEGMTSLRGREHQAARAELIRQWAADGKTGR